VIGQTQSSDENITEANLDAVMEQVPKGAMALAGIAVLLLSIGYAFVYFFIFIPRVCSTARASAFPMKNRCGSLS